MNLENDKFVIKKYPKIVNKLELFGTVLQVLSLFYIFDRLKTRSNCAVGIENSHRVKSGE